MHQSHRLHYRQKLGNLAYLQLDSQNAGIIRDVSQSGAAVQVLTPFPVNRRVRIGLDLPNPRLRFEAESRIVWTDSLGQAGLKFLDLAPPCERLLKEWLMTQLLTKAEGWARDEREELLFSSTSQAAIHLEDEQAAAAKPRPFGREAQPIAWLWFTLSPLRFSRFVDGMALSCAVLLFSLLTLFFTDAFPRGLVAVVFLGGLTVVFGLLYWVVFALGFGITPGTRLAHLARSEPGETAEELGRARFR